MKLDIEKIKQKILKKTKKTENDLASFNLEVEYKRKIYARRTILTITMITMLLAIGIIGSYTGYVAYHEGQGGWIYGLNLQFKKPAWNWAGLYGASFGVGVTQPWEFTLDPNGMQEANVFFECFEVGIEHEIYASTLRLEDLDMENARPATQQEIDAYIGINEEAFDSATLTFTDTMSVSYGGKQISNIPATYSYVGNGTNTTAYPVGILMDGNDVIVIVTKVYNTLVRGFNDRYYNYQMLLPIPHNSSTQYHLFSDPNDVCIGGSESPSLRGIVNGTVTDVSGNPLENVIIVIAGDSTATNEEGYYEFTPEAGEQKIIAIKEGYAVYESNINVSVNNVTTHNIIMELQVEPNEFIDIGPNFESGVDAAGTKTEDGPGEVPFQIEYPQVIEGQDYVIPLTRIYRKLRVGEFSQETLMIQSYKSSPITVNLKLIGDFVNLTQIDKTQISIGSKSDGQATLTFFANNTPGIYNGTINITGGIDAEIPVTIEILEKDKMPIQALLIGLNAKDTTYYAGSTFTFRTDLTNLLSDQEYPVQLLYTLQSMDGKETIWTYRTNVFLKTSLSLIKNVELPPDIKIGDYVIRATAQYMDLTSSTSFVFPVELPFHMTIIYGKIRVWHAFLGFLLLLLIILGAILLKKKIEANKKYHLEVEMKQMPHEGPRNIKVGKIAETDHKAYFNLENFKTHTIVAGSTGGGKSFSAQVIIEEMLIKDVAVIVFDPTAQWTGMLRKLQNKGLLALYPNFGMDVKKDAKAFKGNIRQINDPLELIDVRDYMKPGEIQVFACHKLDPKDIDIFVANTVRQVFRAAFDESEPLRLVLVYDEVHRLLPKFGGSGQGFLQIERACREFRKWGIGVMLISQVLADFVGQIKANINTEVQMRTRDEGDLDRIKTKYGEDVLRSLVKASVGTGMCQNAAYNRGRPFFVTFRPIMHSVARLTDDEIAQYNEYNDKVDQLYYELDQLEKEKQDVFDLKLELKLALDKVKQGNFNMAKIYLEGLEPRIKKFFEKLGIEPKKLERKKASKEEIEADLAKAKAERKAQGADDEEEKKEEAKKKMKPEERFKQDVSPDKILHLKNDMLVVNPKSLYSEIQAMKDKDFEEEIKNNTFAIWLRDAVSDEELAKLIEQETEKQPIMSLLEKREKGEKLPKFEEKRTPEEIKGNTEEKDEKNKKQKKDVSDEKNQEEEKKAFEELSKEPENMEKNTEATKLKTGEESKQKQNDAEKNTQELKNNTKENKENNNEGNKKGNEEKSNEEKNNEDETNEVNKNKEENKNTNSDINEKIKEKNKDKNATKEAFEELSKDPENKNTEINLKEEYKKECEPQNYFRLEDGYELKSIKQLVDHLNEMPDEMFKNHVKKENNDFANWIENVFNKPELANKIRTKQTKEEIKQVLSSDI